MDLALENKFKKKDPDVLCFWCPTLANVIFLSYLTSTGKGQGITEDIYLIKKIVKINFYKKLNFHNIFFFSFTEGGSVFDVELSKMWFLPDENWEEAGDDRGYEHGVPEHTTEPEPRSQIRWWYLKEKVFLGR